MDLIERYVHAVGERLHPARRNQVEAELRASILDELEARATPASLDDVVAVLTRLGDPERMAAEYEPGQQFLIGPQLFPQFKRCVRLALTTSGIMSAVVFFAVLPMRTLAGFGVGTLLVEVLVQGALAAVVALGVLVGAFTLLQRYNVKKAHTLWSHGGVTWDPRSLPRTSSSDTTSRFESASGLAAAAIALCVIDVIARVAHAAAPNASAALQPLIRDQVTRDVVLLQVALLMSAVAHAISLGLGRRHVATTGLRLVADAVALFVFVMVPFQLLEHRAAMIESGASPIFVRWLLINAFIAAAVVVVILAYQWRRSAQSRAAGSGRSTGSTKISVALAALFFVSVPSCVVAQRAAGSLTSAPVQRNSELPEGITSPEVTRDGRITFRYSSPDARQVHLALEGKEPVAMVRDAAGVWSYTTDPLTPDLYVYFLYVDSLPAHDPANPIVLPMVGTRRESLVRVPGVSPALWDSSAVPAGSLRRMTYQSTRFREPRDVWVYTPPGYDAASSRRYPVLYLLHGAGSDARAWSAAGRANVILDNLLAERAVEPMIVAMPLGYGFPNAATRAREMLSPATNQLAVSHAFGESLMGEVVPFIEREFRVRPDRESRAIAGFSMGGSQALHIGLLHPEAFGYAASFGGAFIMYGARYSEWFPALGTSSSAALPSLYLSVGSHDFLASVNRQFAGWLKAHGALAEIEEVSGGHTWQVWRRELIRLAPQLFRPNTPPTTAGNTYFQ